MAQWHADYFWQELHGIKMYSLRRGRLTAEGPGFDSRPGPSCVEFACSHCLCGFPNPKTYMLV